MLINRVGSHMVFVYTARKNVRLLFHNDVQAKVNRDFSMFFHRYPESFTPFSSPHFPRSNNARISLIKLLTLSTDSVTKYLVAKIEPEL